MATYAKIEYTYHAENRMRERRISRLEVEAALRFGEGRPGRDGTWVYEYRTMQGTLIRVIVLEEFEAAVVITVVKLRKHT